MTIKELTDSITQKGIEFTKEWDHCALDLFLGPGEYYLLISGFQTACQVREWHYNAGPIFYKGLRVWMLASPGIEVGIVSHRS